MAKTLRNGRQKGSARFIMLHWYETDSPAWASLSGDAVKVLVALRRRFNGTNNGSIGYGVREAEAIGLSKNKAALALLELTRTGFIRVGKASGFDQKRLAREWVLTSEPYAGQPATMDFMRWSPQSDGGAKSKTQSRRRDTQSHGRDYGAADERKLAPTVPPAGLSEPISAAHSPAGGTHIDLPRRGKTAVPEPGRSAKPVASAARSPGGAGKRGTVVRPPRFNGKPKPATAPPIAGTGQIDLEDAIAAEAALSAGRQR